MKTKSDAFGFAVWAFCFMPEHIHFLLEGTSHGSDLKKFISSYKQHTAFHYKKSVTQDFSPASREEDRAKALNYGGGCKLDRAETLNRGGRLEIG